MNILELAILKKMVGGGGGSGTDNYNDLSNLPQINGETLAGNKTAENLGLQDALTFDSAPTEDSANPVKSGGVYNALAGKQDNLTFDGVYNASTNKAATESTVTNAIAGLDVSALSVDADETISSISETDGKISVIKQDIAIASNQVTAMTGYTKPSSAPANPAIQTSDTANQAFGKLEFKADTNQTNILSVKNDVIALEGNKIGVNNFNIGAYVTNPDVTVVGDSLTVNKTVTLPITVPKTGKYYLLANVSNVSVGSGGSAYLFVRQSTTNLLGFTFSTTGDISGEFTVTDASALNFLFSFTSASVTIKDIMIVSEEAYNAGFTSYQPFALPNYDLTQLQSEDRAALAEEIDAGPKNKFDFASLSNPTLNNTTVTKTDSSIVVTSSGSYARAVYSFDLNAGTYKLRLSASDITNESGSDTGMFVGLYKSSTITSNNELCRIYCTTAGDNYVEFNHAGGTVYVAFYINASSTSYTNTYTISQMMICTLADWKISQKFVPYRPDWDLVGTLFPTSYTTPAVNSSVSSKLSIICGGYAKMGNLVTINMRVSVSDTISAGSQLFYNLPSAYTGTVLSPGASVVACLIAFLSGSNGSDSTGAITYEGSNVPSALTIPMSELTAGTYVISATYLSA